jgi:hypothetical protein
MARLISAAREFSLLSLSFAMQSFRFAHAGSSPELHRFF